MTSTIMFSNNSPPIMHQPEQPEFFDLVSAAELGTVNVKNNPKQQSIKVEPIALNVTVKLFCCPCPEDNCKCKDSNGNECCSCNKDDNDSCCCSKKKDSLEKKKTASLMDCGVSWLYSCLCLSKNIKEVNKETTENQS